MLEDYLIDYEDNDYVYVIEGCLYYYVQSEPLDNSKGPCEVCGTYDWPYVDGYVYDIRKARDEYDLYRIQYEREIRDKMIESKNVLSNDTYYEMIDKINVEALEQPKRLLLKK